MLNKIRTLEELKELSKQLPQRLPYLKLLVLFGSRATGKVHAQSDWDFAALYDEEIRLSYMKDPFSWFEVDLVLSQVFEISNTEIDVVELNHCSPLIGYLVARDGKLLYEKQAGEFTEFQMLACKTYADTAKFRKAQRQSIELWLHKWGV